MTHKISLGVFLVLFIILLLYLFIRPNIHVVIPKKVYRSAQLSPGDLVYFIHKEGIKSVINLRGGDDNNDWYRDEVNAVQSSGIHYYHLQMNAYQITTASNLQALVNLIQTAPQPILFHCAGGSDRTGLASALTLILEQNADLATAKQQYTWPYLVIYNDSTALLTMPYYEKWLEQNNLSSNRDNLLRWIGQLKAGVNYPCDWYDGNCLAHSQFK